MSLLNLGTVTIDEFNSQDYPRLHLTSETLTWDPTMDLYEQQENAIMDYSGNIVRDAAMRGHVPTLMVNEIQSLTTDMADMMHDCNFHRVLTSCVVVSSVNTSLSGHVQLRKTAPIDFMTLAARWMIALGLLADLKETRKVLRKRVLSLQVLQGSYRSNGCDTRNGNWKL